MVRKIIIEFDGRDAVESDPFAWVIRSLVNYVITLMNNYVGLNSLNVK